MILLILSFNTSRQKSAGIFFAKKEAAIFSPLLFAT